MRWLLEGGRVLDPALGLDQIANVLIDGDRIEAVRPDVRPEGVPVVSAAGVPVFAVSTFDTDYVLVKADKLAEAVAALQADGYAVVWLS